MKCRLIRGLAGANASAAGWSGHGGREGPARVLLPHCGHAAWPRWVASFAVAVTCCSQGRPREGRVEGLVACGAGRGGAERPRRRRSRPPFAAARRRARRAPASSPGALRSPFPAPRAPRGPAAVTRQAARGRLALRFVEPGDGRGLFTCSCESPLDRRWELLVEPGKVKVCLGSGRPGGPGSRPQRLPAPGLPAPVGFRSQGMGRGPDRPETLMRRHLLPRVKSSYVGLLQRRLFVVCSFLQLVVPGGRLGSDCYPPPPETCGAACSSPQAGGCPALPAGPSCAVESLQPG